MSELRKPPPPPEPRTRPAVHRTLRFIEQPAPDARITGVLQVEVRIANQVAGRLSFYEDEWDAIWRAIRQSLRTFEVNGIYVVRDGKNRD